MKQVADGVFALELEMNLSGRSRVIHPVLITGAEGAALVDAGLPGQLDDLRREVAAAGADFGDIRRVVLTHQDIDHIGALPEVVGALEGDVEVLAHEDDRPYIEGERTPIKLSPEQLARMVSSLPGDERRRMESLLASPPSARLTRTISDGEVLPVHGGIRVIHTPGHTPGHISLFLEGARVLISGDELNVEDGELVGPAEGATPDMERALASLAKLAPCDVEYVICYHGGVYGPGARERISALAEGR
ncbi:MBL fold metallo-hydrolase [Rubrobacter calidifluminis]|uniref:MBL fold metallo-hydrolase n=1 Tax=Rubrobacter calidifluminis TaxID=1392640 RepID=UPI00235DEC70|nr:MBL fold metallo-hydrolase [Rubrobacter calidifluminis]